MFLLWSDDLFLKLTFSKKIFQEHYMSVTGLDLDQDRRSIGPDLGSNCLQRSSTDVVSCR